jgi:dipeptidyl aminopeptidase/acylaminoacyl peptidase
MRKLFLLALAAAGLGALPGRAAEPRVPIDAFVEQQQFSMPRLSPDGKHLAVNVRIRRGERSVPTMTVYTLPKLEIVSMIALPGFEIPVNFFWISNERLVVKKGLEIGERERPIPTGEIVAVNLDGSKQEYLYGYKGFKQSSRGDRYGDDHGEGIVTHVPRARDGHVLVGSYNWEGDHSLLYDINSANSVRRLIADIPAKHLDFIVQNDGKPRFAYGVDENNNAVLYRLDDATGEWRRVTGKQLGTAFRPIAFTPDDKAFYARYSATGGPTAIVREDLASGERSEVAADALGSIDLIEYTAEPAVPFALGTDVGIPSVRYLDEKLPDAALHKTLAGLFPDAFVHFINFTDDGQKLLFSVASDRDPGSFYLYDKATGKADLLMTNMPQIEPAGMGVRKPVQFTARDGLPITGYLTLPKDAAGHKSPMVVMPHGGPFDIYDTWYFNADAQFLASRGYAVLQVNFRGSDARGPRFLTAGYREWGGKLIDDIVDGVKWADAQPEIDAARVCAYGWSYGAYASMMLAVREPSMFRCAVGAGGVYALGQLYDGELIKGEKHQVNYLIKTLGDDQAALAAISPVSLAARITVPVLLVHGAKDKVAPISHAHQMRAALANAGHPPEWMEMPNEGHGFYDSEHRKQFYQKLEAFLGQHIGK